MSRQRFTFSRWARLFGLVLFNLAFNFSESGQAWAQPSATAVPQIPGDPVAGVRAGAPAPVRRLAAETTLYSIGDPTAEEQLYLEYINRARANPPNEGNLLRATTDAPVVDAYNYFHVDLSLLATAFAAIAPAPPLAMSAKLAASARGHSQDMLNHQYQGHTGSDGSDPGTRMSAAGYNWMAYAENVYAYIDYVPGASSSSGNANVRITGIAPTADGRVTLDFSLISGPAGVWSIETASSIHGPWSVDASASIQSLGNNRYRALCEVGSRRFYRVSGQ